MKRHPYQASPSQLRQWHNQWLFTLAFPPNKAEYEQAQRALDDFAGREYPFPDNKKFAGLPGSVITGSFSYAIARWLSRKFPDDAEIESSGAEPDAIKVFFRRVLPRCEFEAISFGRLGLLKRIDRLKGRTPGSRLNWLQELMDTHLKDDHEKEQLFDQLQIFIRCRVREKNITQSNARAPVSETGFHRQEPRKTSFRKIIRSPIPAASRLLPEQKQQLMDLAKASLFFLYRETEPFTYAHPDEVLFFELENGLSVALYGMQPDRRLSIESYIGYMAFKNAIPVAYGGGWLFGKRCQFGLNIFPAFRGGASFYLLAQLMRVYHQHFGASRFVVPPYQFGHHNPEAIRTGAFWFYYKAGFRPEDPALQQIALEESRKKKMQQGYRSPAHILTRLTHSPLCLCLTGNDLPVFDAALLSKEVTRWIQTRYAGDRQAAGRDGIKGTKAALGLTQLRGWNGFEKKALEEWSLILQSSIQWEEWKPGERKKLLQLIRLKGKGPEHRFIRFSQELVPLWERWNRPAFLQRLSH